MDKTKVFEAAGKFAAKGQFDKAAKEYQRILEEDPKDVRALQKLSEIFQKANKPKEATDLMLRVAEGYTEQGFFLKAVAVYKQVLKVGPERVEVNQRLAQLYQQLGLIGDATQQWQLVANFYDRQGNVKESLGAVRKMVELDPDNVASQVKLAELYARENMTKEAVGEFRKAANYLRRNSRIDDWIRVLERIAQLTPDDVPVAKDLSKHYLSQNDTKRALAKLQVCFRADPKDVDTLQLLAQAFANLGQDAKTISVFRELASIYNIRGDKDSERTFLEKILALAPQDEEANTRMAELNGRPVPQAHVVTFEATLPPQTRPKSMAPPPAAKPQVIAPPPPREMTSPPPRAVPPPPAAVPPPPPAPVVAARQLDPRLPPAIAKILTETDVYLKYGLLPKAAEHVRKALIDDPSCIPAHEKLLTIVERQGKTDEVQHELERLVELAREAGDVERDRAFTQELAQRIPDHPLVLAAAAAAELPPLEDDELIIDPDADASIAPPPRATAAGLPSDSMPELPLLEEEATSDEDDVVMDPEPLSMAPPAFHGRPSASAARFTPPQDAAKGTTLSFRLPPEQIDEPVASNAEPELIDAPDENADLAMQAAFENSLPPLAPGHGFLLETEAAHAEAAAPGAPHEEPARHNEPALEEAEQEASSPFEAVEDQTGPLEAEAPPVDEHDEPVEHESIAPELDEPEPVAEEEAAPFDAAEEQAASAEEPAAEAPVGTHAEELAEAEFLVSQGLTEDAQHILEEILAQEPEHAGAAALLAQIAPAAEAPPPGAESVPPGPVSHVDLTRELADELAGENLGDPAPPPIANPHSVTDVLSEFKKAVSNTVSAEDSQTHYDLGIAYKEMGLLDEAIHEFEVACQSRGRKHVLDCLMMLGMCHLEKQELRDALEYFTQALHAPGLTLEASKEAHFQLGLCHDQLEELPQALEHYARVYKADPEYRDVKPRLIRVTRLVKGGGRPGAPARPNGAAASGPAPIDVPPEGEPRAGRGKIGYI